MARWLLVTVTVLAVSVGIGMVLISGHETEEETLTRISSFFINSAQNVAVLGGKLGYEEVRINQWFSRTFSFLYRGPDDPLVQTEEMTMAGTPVIIYHYMGADNPKKQGLAPAIIFIHGGGWVVLNTDYYHKALQRIVRESKLMLISVEYKLAPDSLFPGPVYENAAVVKHFINNANKFGNDKNKIITIGDSAGGNLVAAVNLLLRDEQFKPQPLAQVLTYPFLQLMDLQLPSYQNDTGVIISMETCVNYGLWYLFGHNEYKDQLMTNTHVSAATLSAYGHRISHKLLPKRNLPDHYQAPKRGRNKGISPEFDKLMTNPLFSPIMSNNLRGLPRAFIQTCNYDVLRDDGYLYAHALTEAGVTVKHKNYETSFHGGFLKNPVFADDIVSYIYEIL